MTSAKRNVLFFGSVSASVVGHSAHNATLLSQLEKQRATLKLRLTATAASFRSEEVLGSVATSAPMPLDTSLIKTAESSAPSSGVASPSPSASPADKAGRSGEEGVVVADAEGAVFPLRARPSFFLPVMLELAQDPAADTVAPETDSEADESDPAPTRDGRGKGGAGGRTDHGYYAVTVNISADITRSSSSSNNGGGGAGRAVMVRSKRVLLPSLSKQAGRDACTIVRVQLSSRLVTRSAQPATTLAAEEVEKDVAADGDVALTVYLMLRVIDLSERLSAAEEAVDNLRRFLGVPPPIPRVSLSLTKRVKAPYGSMPLAELHNHYRLFYSRYYSKVLKPSKEVVRMLTGGAPGLKEASESYPFRWNALEEVRLDRVLLGEESFAPLLLTLSHCCNLRTLVADRNGLGDMTCARLYALLSRARYLRCLSLAGNNIYEGGADQLLRLARRNHRLSLVNVEGNWCSDAILQRIAKATAASQLGIQQDPLNVFAEQYDYLASPHSIPGVTLKLALSVWAMLTAAPVGDVDVWVRNLTTKDMDQYQDDSLSARRRVAKAAAAAPLSAIPPAARAPLLSEVMRTVYVGVCMAVPDPLVRSVFVDLEEARRRRLETLQGRADAKARRKEEEGGVASEDSASDSGSIRSDDSLAEANARAKQLPVASASRRPPLGSAADVVGDLPAEVARVLGVCQSTGACANGIDIAQALAETEDDIYNASFLKIVVTTMRAVASGSPWEEVREVLRGIGVLHRSLGVRIEDYWLATHIFIKGLSVTLGTEEFTSERLAAFLIVMALGIRTVAEENGVVEPL